MTIYNYIKKRVFTPKELEEDLQLRPNVESKYVEIAKIVKKEVEDNQLFLNPELNLVNLGELLAINRTYLSKSINSVYGKNFNDFINDYRIARANRLLSLSKYRNRPIGDIGKMSGFNSYSSFIRQYRSRYDFAPRDYRNDLYSL